MGDTSLPRSIAGCLARGFGLTALALALVSLPLPARDERAAEIARIHLEAIGGARRIEALEAMRATGYVYTGGKKVRFTLLAARPNRIRLETEGNGRTLLQGSDGIEPPWEFDTGSAQPRPRAMPEATAKTFVVDAEFDDPLVAPPSRGIDFEYVGESSVQGRKLLRLLVTRKLTDTYSVYVDPATYLILYRVETRTSGGRQVQITTRYDEFRPVDGVLLPHEITTIIDGRITQQTKIELITANPKLAGDTFSRPKSEPETKPKPPGE